MILIRLCPQNHFHFSAVFLNYWNNQAEDMGNATSSAPPILEKDTGNQPKIENQQATSSAPPILKKDMGNQPKNENQQATSSAPPILKKEMGNQPKNEDQQAATSSAPNILKTEEGQAISAPSAVGLIDSLEQQYHKIKEHAETYPYVWGSYILVYGGFGLWVTYRWRKLRKTEVRVRALQEKLRKLVEAEDSANAAKVVEKGSTSSEKPSK